jgi:hypothetical protein
MSADVRDRPSRSDTFLWTDLWTVSSGKPVYLAFRHERASRYVDESKLPLRSKFVERALAHTKGSACVFDAARFGIKGRHGNGGLNGHGLVPFW